MRTVYRSVHAAGVRHRRDCGLRERTRGHDERLVASVLSGDGGRLKLPVYGGLQELSAALRSTRTGARPSEVMVPHEGHHVRLVESFFPLHLWWIYQVTNDRKWKSEAYRILSRSNKSLTHILSHTLFLFARLCIHIHDTMRTLRFCLEPSANNIQKR